ncbi:hypothetical protein G3I48_17740 [Streptomyces griseus]|nr:hypothetical protein [Streptomyces griseus]
MLQHPQVGPLELHYQKLLIPGAQGQTLVTNHAHPGSDSEDRLRPHARSGRLAHRHRQMIRAD